MKTNYIIALCIGLVCWNCKSPKQEQLPFYNTPDFTAVWHAEEVSHKLAPFQFQNQDNKSIDEKDLLGKIHVANFFFTICPSLCPRLMESMQKVSQAFPSDSIVWIMSYSVMPNRDSVSVLKNYAITHKINTPKWNLLTGDKKAIYQLARKSYFADENLGVQRKENDFLHTENFILVDKQLRIRGIYNGTIPLDIEHLIEDIKVLKAEE